MRWALLLAILTAWAVPLLAEVRLVDGDTLDVDGVRYRLAGIDAPEAGQKCTRASGSYNCGAAAMDKLDQLTHGAQVVCTAGEDDGRGRIIARCLADGMDIGARMVASGHAWAFTRYSDRYAGEELEAKARGLGIWRAQNEPPWEYRARRWRPAEQTAPSGCPIKGNISANGRIYHAPWSPWYDRTRINEAKGERWFCDETEAVRAGWRAPRWR